MSLEFGSKPIKAWIKIKLKVKTTRVQARPIYHDYPIICVYMPSDFLGFSRVMRFARVEAERILKRRKETIARLMKFFIVEERKPFRTLIDEVAVNERYEIEYFTKPKDERLRGIYYEWNLYRFRKTKERKYLLKILGWPERRPEPRINLEWPWYTYEGEKRDITDLPLGYLTGPPKRDKAPWEL